MNETSIEAIKNQINAIRMDNAAIDDALNMKNYRALKLILERQKIEINELSELINKL